MTSTVTDLREFGATAVLDAVVTARRTADREEAKLLALAVHWVDLHPVTDPNPSASTAASSFPFGTVEPDSSLGGDGTPDIAQYAVEELAAALGLGYHAGLRLVTEAVELAHRLPKLWGLVQSGQLQAWKARQVATATQSLSWAAVGFVDRHAATTGTHNKIPPLNPLIHEARLRCDPDQAAGVEQAALDARGVWFDHRESTATTDLTARLDTLDALDLNDSIIDLAATLGRLGDTRPLDIRRAGALGLLAHPQRALDLVHGTGHTLGRATTHPTGDTDTGVGADGTAATSGIGLDGCGLSGSHGTLYLHITRADLETGLADGTGGGRVEKLGTATLQLLRDWLQRLNTVTIRPVLDPDRGDAADRHEPPAWMRETVILRDRHCVFPGCGIDARSCDLDHITAYRSPDDGGPPGQTHAGNLACLCRRHHRLKTFTGWTYLRQHTGDYQWTSPTGRSYTVAPE